MPVNKRFIEATNFLKNVKNINFSEQAKRLGLKRHTFDSYRGERLEVKDFVMVKMQEVFPEIERIIEKYTEPDERPGTLNEPMDYLNGGSHSRELIATQKKLIAKLEEENARLKERMTKLEGENKALKEIITKRK